MESQPMSPGMFSGRSWPAALTSVIVLTAGLGVKACGQADSALEPVSSLAAESQPGQAQFLDNVTGPFGRFGGIEYVRHTGRFEGTTTLGSFRVPYEIVAPADPARANGAVLIEPPHFSLGLVGRDLALQPHFLFERGFAHAAVGFGTRFLNLLDPAATDLVIAGETIEAAGSVFTVGTVDEEIIVRFVHALSADPFARSALGDVHRRYAYGASQTSAALLQTLHSPGGPGLFDLVLLHVAMWRPPFAAGEFHRLEGEFAPLTGVGRVIFVESEGDLLVSEAEQFRRAASHPDYRVYEVAGAAHQPTPLNPLDHGLIARAVFLAGDAWVRHGIAPPPSTLLEPAPEGGVDPLYGVVTGIARDGDGNARGGVPLPELAIGQARFVAADFDFEVLPGLAGLTGLSVDLSCEKFRNHGDYVRQFTAATNALRDAGFLLQRDASAIVAAAARSDVAKPEACP
jgi:hypothetical protein